MKTRNYGMDLLRCISIFIVVMTHLSLIYPPNGKMQKLSMVFSILDGVTIFFVLSGFLVGYQLIFYFSKQKREISKSLNRFFISRWFKTLPSYYILLAVNYWLNYSYVKSKDVSIFKYITFTQNLNINHPPFFQEAWSLSIEEWFYLTVPLLLVFLVKGLKISVKRSLLVISVLMLIVAHVTRLVYIFQDNQKTVDDFGNVLRNRVLPRIDAPIFGVMAAYFYFYFPEKFKNSRKIISRFLIALTIILAIAGVFIYALFKDGFAKQTTDYLILNVFAFLYFDITQLTIALLLPFFFYIHTPGVLLKRAITYISKLSYSIYLVHLGLIIGVIMPFVKKEYFANTFFTDNKFGLLILYLSLTALISVALYHVVEVPFFRIKKWLIRTRLEATGR